MKREACALALALAACSFSDPRMKCTEDSDCEGSNVCYRSFCIPKQARGDAGVNAGGAAADGGGPTSVAQAGTTGTIRNGLGGDAAAGASAAGSSTADSSAAGSSAAGSSAAGSNAAGSSAGGADVGASGVGGSGAAGTSAAVSGGSSSTCQAGETRDCTVNVTPRGPTDRCNLGTQRCENGVFGPCLVSAPRSDEVCNGLDDDCDGNLDENVRPSCYPAGQTGCTSNDNGANWSCTGLCTAGTQTCMDGKLQPCSGATVPVKESCSTPADEDCDGATDEQCACTATESMPCYAAPSVTMNVGPCKAGTETCKDGMFGACTGAVTPQTETCANEGVDDDCNGMQDDVHQRGAACSVTGNSGVCQSGTLQCQSGNPALVCVAHAPSDEVCNALDDDCDGKVDETFNLQTDVANCGACGTACAKGESCCGGHCANPQSDVNNCGMCGKACLSGARPGCCSGSCVDLLGGDNCGTCGHACGLLGGVVCSCAMTSSGTACMAPLGLCL